jgi:hypothetical protein
MGDFVHWRDQIVRWCEVMFSRYQAWLLPGVLVVLALIGLILLYSELRQDARDRKKWKVQPRRRPLRSNGHEDRLKAS